MKPLLVLLVYSLIGVSCKPVMDKEDIKKEILRTEKAFEKMTRDKSVAEAFTYFADANAVINRGKDSLIFGKENIRHFYETRKTLNATVNWTPDFVEVSEDGTLGYTYGKYVWNVIKESGDTIVSIGIFHTVWKKQKDGTWKYVWD